jgi:hypothetical protein
VLQRETTRDDASGRRKAGGARADGPVDALGAKLKKLSAGDKCQRNELRSLRECCSGKRLEMMRAADAKQAEIEQMGQSKAALGAKLKELSAAEERQRKHS